MWWLAHECVLYFTAVILVAAFSKIGKQWNHTPIEEYGLEDRISFLFKIVFSTAKITGKMNQLFTNLLVNLC